MSSSLQPNTTLYIKNLNDKIKKDEIRSQLFALFTTYGRILDIVALKGPKMKGQAFIVFTDLTGATAALRGCEGMVFYDKPMHIEYAKTKSYATRKREDPDFVPPTSVHTKNAQNGQGMGEKRPRDDRMDEDVREAKRERPDNDDDDDDDEEMEIEDDEDSGKPQSQIPSAVQHQSARLMCLNLPQEVTDNALAILFQQYQGFHSVSVTPSPTPNAANQRAKMAYVMFDSPDLASVAKDALDGFTLKKGWVMSVSYI